MFQNVNDDLAFVFQNVNDELSFAFQNVNDELLFVFQNDDDELSFVFQNVNDELSFVFQNVNDELLFVFQNVNDKLSLVSSPSSFASVLQRLSKTLPGNMVSNLSVPIAFVCLLHIANEKVKFFLLFNINFRNLFRLIKFFELAYIF